jgi:hypothetical protein
MRWIAFVRVGVLQVSGGGERKCAKATDDQQGEQRHRQDHRTRSQ